MVARKPLVVGSDGLPQQLQSTDTLAGPHAKFTGTTNLAFTINLGATQTVTLPVSPVVAGDSLAAQEDISIQPTGALPGGINLAYAYASATNTVTIGVTSSSLLTVSQSVSWRVTAHR